jgi:cytochrome c oxidase accessory protein FixG
VDCSICVQVCPTGIDIRDGLQYECIGCAACIDGCDQVMDKMGYPRGLIRYSTENALQHGWGALRIVERVMRPRVLAYTGILAAIAVAGAASLMARLPVKMDVIRDRASLAREVEGGRIENVYRLQLMNTDEHPRRLALGVAGDPHLEHLELLAEQPVTLAALETRLLTVRVRAEAGHEHGSRAIEFLLMPEEQDVKPFMVREKSRFLVP